MRMYIVYVTALGLSTTVQRETHQCSAECGSDKKKKKREHQESANAIFFPSFFSLPY